MDEADAKVIREVRTNRYDEKSKTLELTPAQAYSLEQMRKYWDREFAEGDCAMDFSRTPCPAQTSGKDVADFFFWTAWAAGTNRPGKNYQLHQQLARRSHRGQHGNDRGPALESGSILSLFAVLGIVVYVVHRYGFFYGESKAVEAAYRLLETPITPSQRPVLSFFSSPGCCSSSKSSMAGCWPITRSTRAAFT